MIFVQWAGFKSAHLVNETLLHSFYMLLQQIKYALSTTLFHRERLRPTYIIPNFKCLKIPPTVKFVILDKDNCFARPHETSVLPEFKPAFDSIINKVDTCILSNEAGDATADKDNKLARKLENSTGVKVLRHKKKKPLCYDEILYQIPCKPSEVLVVGDRLYTDVVFANLLGAQSVWSAPGVHPGYLNKLEIYMYNKFKSNI